MKRADVWLKDSGTCIISIFDPKLTIDDDGWTHISGRGPRGMEEARAIAFQPKDGFVVAYVEMSDG